MGKEIQHRTDAIRKLADKHEGACGDLLKQTRYVLNDSPRKASTGAFTMYGFELAMAHSIAIEWADRDLMTKAEELRDFRGKLHVVAKCHDSAERANTMKA